MTAVLNRIREVGVVRKNNRTDWMLFGTTLALSGFGLLMIIDHGEGFMSLYGHNQALYRDVGDWVEAGHVIASTGDSGGQAETGLYFELRQNGKPIDPLKWLSGQPKPVQTAKRS